MTRISKSNEIEKRYILDPSKGLYLPRHYQEFHQAEIGSGIAEEVIRTFRLQTDGLLSGQERVTGDAIKGLFSLIHPKESIKLRIRRIFNPHELSLRAEFTMKKKLPPINGFKRYVEYNIPIHPILGLSLIEYIAPGHRVDGHLVEHGVRKLRYNITSSDGNMWDIDVFQGLNAGLTLGEVEVINTRVKIILERWVVKQVNGDPRLRILGTAELQNKPLHKRSLKEINLLK